MLFIVAGLFFHLAVSATHGRGARVPRGRMAGTLDYSALFSACFPLGILA